MVEKGNRDLEYRYRKYCTNASRCSVRAKHQSYGAPDCGYIIQYCTNYKHRSEPSDVGEFRPNLPIFRLWRPHRPASGLWDTFASELCLQQLAVQKQPLCLPGALYFLLTFSTVRCRYTPKLGLESEHTLLLPQRGHCKHPKLQTVQVLPCTKQHNVHPQAADRRPLLCGVDTESSDLRYGAHAPRCGS